MLHYRLGLSERRARQIAGQHRSTQRHEPWRMPDDGALRHRLREISRPRRAPEHIRYDNGPELTANALRD